MKWFIDMKISGKIITTFLAGAFLSGLIGIYSITNLMSMEKADKKLYEDVVTPMKSLNSIDDSFQRLRINVRDYVFSSEEMERKNFSGRIDELKSKIDNNSKLFESTLKKEETRSTFNQFKGDYDKYISIVGQISTLTKAGKSNEAFLLMKGDGRNVARATQSSIDKLIEGKDVQGKAVIDENLSLSNGAKTMTIAFTVLSVIGAIVVGLIIAKLISDPIKKCVEFAKTVSGGDLTVKIEVDRGDEAGLLYEALDDMAEHLRMLIQRVHEAADHIASASSQLKDNAGQTSRGVDEQSNRAAQIATAAEEMSQTVTDVARNASEIATSAAGTTGTAKDGASIVNKSVNEVKAIADTVSESAQFITTLGERSKQIGEIVSVIKDIADQTNLLALNAAIEAARAGEQGRGFAVVADEVRKLAERTSKATSEISGMIGSIQSEVDKAVSSMDEATRRVETGVQYSTQAGTALENIVSSVEGLHTMVHQIATATEEMSTVSEQITNDIEAIARVSGETSGSVMQTSMSASSLSELSSELIKIVGNFNTDRTSRPKSVSGADSRLRLS